MTRRAIAWRIGSALLVLLWCASAAAWELRVDASGGPADLSERVERAVGAWRDAGVDVESVERSVVVRYGHQRLLGPDAITLVITGGGAGVDIEVLVRAEAERLDDGLLIALGIALGGAPGVGVLAPGLSGDEPRRVTPSDASALFRDRVAGDITGDEQVGFADLLELAAQWGRSGVNLPADLDGDGSVGTGDLERLRALYTLRDLDGEAATDERDDETDDGGEDTDEEGAEDAPVDDAR